MDKGKSTTASETGEIKSSESDDERVAATGWPRPPCVVDDGASSSTAGGGGASSSTTSSSAPSATQAAIGPFEDGQYVRLRNRGRGGYYLFANENGRRVCVDRRRGMVNTAWAVQILRGRVLLRSAYGRYLSSTFRLAVAAGVGLVGCYTTQCVFEYPDHSEIEWSATSGKRGSVVLLQGTSVGTRALRANGRYQRWNTEVTFGPVNLNQVSSMMEWEVQVIPVTLQRPPYQPNAAIRLPEVSEDVIDIIYSLAWFDHNGSVEHEQWIPMRFRGRSLTRLRNEIANRVGGVQSENLTLFTQAGFLAKPIPLLTDLHLRHDPRMILVFTTDSPGCDELRFPDLAAE